jgi:hypothetical protein
MLSCAALRWRLKTEKAQWPFVSWPRSAGKYDGAETKTSEYTVHNGLLTRPGDARTSSWHLACPCLCCRLGLGGVTWQGCQIVYLVVA